MVPYQSKSTSFESKGIQHRKLRVRLELGLELGLELAPHPSWTNS